MTDQRFPEWQDPAQESFCTENALTINGDPQYDTAGTIIIGMWKYGEYQNIVLDAATALRFADAIQKHFAPQRVAA